LIRQLTNYIISPVGRRADFCNELLTQDTRAPLYSRIYSAGEPQFITTRS
jgi:hypothetical protein